jgi:hypothetical protein
MAQGGTSWLTLEGAGGVGDGVVIARVDANTTTTPRSATLTVAGQVVSVSQAPAPVVVVEEVRLNGPATQLSGACPSVEFFVENRLVRTNGATDFGGNQCQRLGSARNVDVRGTSQPDGSVLATRVRVMGTTNDENGAP